MKFKPSIKRCYVKLFQERLGLYLGIMYYKEDDYKVLSICIDGVIRYLLLVPIQVNLSDREIWQRKIETFNKKTAIQSFLLKTHIEIKGKINNKLGALL
ncbi:Uncharacterised protein [Legionella israelensis]|uniref:Uncharacterized protein n=1 Tax=Legionella israelensis TaxID=454 RepID=A0A0W0WEL5_9GAMM|nr:hypothetical protein [Legionella israelensis]KTD30702.1 hypothetical protein Lisr_0688 [Legionella israelensis]SCY13469.1 hypothetical protein SAMN02746069_01400 [Legionella israelensis DSM 19235]STX59382.1 Uncharacterised protein [Legionella israelensis]